MNKYTKAGAIVALIVISHFYGIYIGELRGRMGIMIDASMLTKAGQ